MTTADEVKASLTTSPLRFPFSPSKESLSTMLVELFSMADVLTVEVLLKNYLFRRVQLLYFLSNFF